MGTAGRRTEQEVLAVAAAAAEPGAAGRSRGRTEWSDRTAGPAT